ncbi:RNA polymerase sigma factor sigma-70 region 4 domain-containing protein [Aliarcobacter vitoriensis]|uniref:Uncharacterized protein n=1 Tax=Aliarcobacter vitoriensis TaxID=2011099 RepID=A0A366MT94_9BACT|nr:hypothetical protein [Aliarcobacter vitoriensis]RBQ28840.1 hypothetical protein CRU91_07555 [Aliarcobacter vitoriensis]
MKNVTYKEISEDLGKTEGTIKNWSKSHPTLLKYVKIGAFCEHNNLDIDRIKKLIEISDAIKEVNTKS